MKQNKKASLIILSTASIILLISLIIIIVCTTEKHRLQTENENSVISSSVDQNDSANDRISSDAAEQNENGTDEKYNPPQKTGGAYVSTKSTTTASTTVSYQVTTYKPTIPGAADPDDDSGYSPWVPVK